MGDRFTEAHVAATASSLLDRARRRLALREEGRDRIEGRLPEAARVLRDEFGARTVVVVGSLDQPWFWERSDVDLGVEGLRPGSVHEAERRLRELFGRRVDLLLLEELDPSFRQAVLEEGRKVP